MDAEAVKGVIDPFFTTRTTRNVGLGVPLLKLAAEQTGGGIEISSVSERDDPRRHGTRVTAIIQGAPGIEWRFIHETPAGKVELDTRELRQVLGDVPLDNFEVIKWVEDYLKEGYASLI